MRVVLPDSHPAAIGGEVHLADLAGEAWATGHAGMAWEEMTQDTCRALGGFEPDIRHRANDATIALALVAGGQAVTLLRELPLEPRPPGVAVRAIADGPVNRAIFAVTRATDAARPSTQALLAAVRDAAILAPSRPRARSALTGYQACGMRLRGWLEAVLVLGGCAGTSAGWSRQQVGACADLPLSEQ